MFRITEDPSSGSLVQCLAKNYKNDSIVSVGMDKVGVMAADAFPSLPYDKSISPSSASSLNGAIQYFLFQFTVVSLFLNPQPANVENTVSSE